LRGAERCRFACGESPTASSAAVVFVRADSSDAAHCGNYLKSFDNLMKAQPPQSGRAISGVYRVLTTNMLYRGTRIEQ
jgi:hypothetical protein